MNVPLLDLQAQYATIKDKVRAAVDGVFESQRFVLGAQVSALEEEIARSAASRNFEEARAKIALLRTIHPIFEPVSRRLEVEVNAQESGALIERVVVLLGAKTPTKDAALEARRLFGQARALHVKPSTLEPIEEQLRRLERSFGISGPAIELSSGPPLAEKAVAVGVPQDLISPCGIKTGYRQCQSIVGITGICHGECVFRYLVFVS